MRFFLLHQLEVYELTNGFSTGSSILKINTATSMIIESVTSTEKENFDLE